jgi:ATP-dependent exoDNAse (exonuclease V) beta subunit
LTERGRPHELFAAVASQNRAIMKGTTLDRAQQSAAAGTGVVQLILAGPGAGKTTTLAGRFVHLVRQGVDRRRILALTFTKKAADEMKSRIAAALDLPSAAGLNAATQPAARRTFRTVPVMGRAAATSRLQFAAHVVERGRRHP